MITREQHAKIVGANVDHALKELGWTYVQVGEAAELSPKTVKNAASGEVSPTSWTISKLASALYCEPGDLDPSLEQLKKHGAKPPKPRKD